MSSTVEYHCPRLRKRGPEFLDPKLKMHTLPQPPSLQDTSPLPILSFWKPNVFIGTVKRKELRKSCPTWKSALGEGNQITCCIYFPGLQLLVLCPGSERLSCSPWEPPTGCSSSALGLSQRPVPSFAFPESKMAPLHEHQAYVLAIRQTKDSPNMDPEEHVHFEGHSEA